MIDYNISPRIPRIKKFYFLEYFYILLQSIEKSSRLSEVFSLFTEKKHEFRLGESKYRKIVLEKENLTRTQEERYYYTFNQVIEESLEYKIIYKNHNELFLTQDGLRLVKVFEKEGQQKFNEELLIYMEDNYQAFRYLIKLLYEVNRVNSGIINIPNIFTQKVRYRKKKILKPPKTLLIIH